MLNRVLDRCAAMPKEALSRYTERLRVYRILDSKSREKPRSALGTVYFIQCNGDQGPIKIGFTTHKTAQSRMAGMTTGNPYELRILGTRPGTVRDECKLHRKFKNQHLRGEWFAWSEDLAAEARRNQ
jgi:hypothetical protein